MRDAAATFFFSISMLVAIDVDNWFLRGVGLGFAAVSIRAMARQEAQR